MSDRLSDEQVTWWAIGYSRLWGPTMQPHPNGAVPDPDGEVTAMAREVQELRAEVERLTRWKAEAMAVIDQWEAAWEAAGSPGELGDTKSGAMRAAILAERALADRLAEALHWYENTPDPGNDPADVPHVERARTALAAWVRARWRQELIDRMEQENVP